MENRKYGRWLGIGTARIEAPDKPAHVFLDRLPIGGWNGYVYLSPKGVKPPEPEPQRPIEIPKMKTSSPARVSSGEDEPVLI